MPAFWGSSESWQDLTADLRGWPSVKAMAPLQKVSFRVTVYHFLFVIPVWVQSLPKLFIFIYMAVHMELYIYYSQTRNFIGLKTIQYLSKISVTKTWMKFFLIICGIWQRRVRSLDSSVGIARICLYFFYNFTIPSKMVSLSITLNGITFMYCEITTIRWGHYENEILFRDKMCGVWVQGSCGHPPLPGVSLPPALCTTLLLLIISMTTHELMHQNQHSQNQVKKKL